MRVPISTLGLAPILILALVGTLNLGDLDGTNGFRIAGADLKGETGWRASSVGDVNADRFSDVIVSNLRNTGTYVILGAQHHFRHP